MQFISYLLGAFLLPAAIHAQVGNTENGMPMESRTSLSSGEQKGHAPAGVTQHEFTYVSATNLTSATIVGSFNEWQQGATQMTPDRSGRIWRTTVNLPPGNYLYQIVVNGETWIDDPMGGRETNATGGTNSSITLGPRNPFRAPLSWSSYEFNYKVDGSIPESEWSANIDWVEKNLKPWGYSMVCIDGWGDEVFNQDGYRSSHSREWKHDYAWWSRNLQSRGMSLGIYTNPLWILREAAMSCVKIKGTDLPIRTLMNDDEKARFTWVQVDRPGAEQYVKGCIQYYANMGVRYLRVDFLSWYESGRERNTPGRLGPPHTRAQYETALRWMREACDEYGIFLSLVMPNLENGGEIEVHYGHMFRVDEDCAKGGWWNFSENRRGVRLPGWSQYANAFDGLTYWSNVSGKNQIQLDPDFIRLNTFANDDEKKSVVSLCLIAGSPVGVADQYSTIGNNLGFYQNEELLGLNRDGFVGKPLTTDPTNERSQIWTGRMSNGDWVVGLFNREKEPRERDIDFSDLGLTGKFKVRDLWQHKDLGRMESFHASVPAHGCIIIRIQGNSQ